MQIIDYYEKADDWEVVLLLPTGDIIRVNIPKDCTYYGNDFYLNLVFKGDHYR